MCRMRRKDGRLLGPDGFPMCSVTTCQVSLMGCRVYNLRCYICPVHQRASEVMQGDQYMRFCHQCSRLQPLSDFTGNQRSCAASLLRRRKVLEVRFAFAMAANLQPKLRRHAFNGHAWCSSEHRR